jgi:hypothetical protein
MGILRLHKFYVRVHSSRMGLKIIPPNKQKARKHLAYRLSKKSLINNLRRGRDSNPRYPFEYTHFPGVLLQPLGHLSVKPPLPGNYHPAKKRKDNLRPGYRQANGYPVQPASARGLAGTGSVMRSFALALR